MKKSLFICMCLLSISVISCSKKDPVVTVEKATMSVNDIGVTAESWPLIVEANGSVKAWQETIISSQVAGLDILDVYVNVGDKVKKGQLLAKLNSAQVDADLMNQEASLAQAHANLEKAKIESSQAAQLFFAGALSSQELLSYTTTAKTAQAQVKAAQANVNLDHLKLGYTQIQAPDDGVISSSSATVGAIVQTGSELFKIIRNGRLEWQAQVSPNDVSQIKIGQTVDISDGTHVIKGVVRQIAPSLDTITRNVIVYVDIPDSQLLKSDMYVAGNIYAGIVQVQAVPLGAIVNKDGHDYVMVVDSSHHVHETKIQTGIKYNNMVQVLSGIESTVRIVLSGGEFLNESDLVTVVGVSV